MAKSNETKVSFLFQVVVKKGETKWGFVLKSVLLATWKGEKAPTFLLSYLF